MRVYDTIIVGMGAAGCAAAAVLSGARRAVLCLEAQGTVGGRVCTVPLGDGVVELGAEWIHGERPNAVYDLAVENQVPLVSHDLTMKVTSSDGSHVDQGVFNELVNFAMEAGEETPEKPEPLGQYLTRRITEYVKKNHPSLANEEFLPQFLHFMDLLTCNYDSASSWNDVTTHSQYKTVEGDLHLSWHKNGYKTLFDILLNKYNNGPGLPGVELKFKKMVTKISYPQEPQHDVVVTCEDGSQYSARNVIVTLSLGVLKATHKSLFSPPLPEAKVTAINSISYGVMDKIEVLFPRVWWPTEQSFFSFLWKAEDLASVPAEDYWVTRIFGASCPKGSDRVLTLWTSGEEAKLVERLPAEVVKTMVMELLRRFMGRDRDVPEPEDMIRSTWHSNPYTLGSYSFEGVRAPGPRLREALAAPVRDVTGAERLLFAGEATHPCYFSTVHGAILTGRREANRLLTKSKL